MFSPEIFIMQADRICHELFEQFSENLFEKIELKQYELEQKKTGGDSSLPRDDENLSFEIMLKREQLILELKKGCNNFVVSEGFSDQNKISFFVIYINNEEKRTYEKARIFFDKLMEELFSYFNKEFLADNTYFYNGSIISIITRDSIDSLVTEISRRCCKNNEFSLYDNINLSLKNVLSELASTTYEKSEAEGLIYFVDDIEKVNFQFEFKNHEEYGSFDLGNIRLLRKLLELTSVKNDIGIISDTNFIYGLGSIKDEVLREGSGGVLSFEHGSQNFYSVIFEGNRKWTVYENNDEVISIRNNSLVFVNSLISKREFASYLVKVFPEKKDSDDIGAMYGIVKALVKQRKGTILVIKKDAQNFIQKYQDLCMIINPVRLDDKNAEKLSSIDGAIIMDENCICYGFGAVLDGLDTGTGNRGRGSRFNSSERFYNLYKNEENTDLMVFILSDDGNYNFFPDFR